MDYKLIDNIEEYIDDIITLDDNFYEKQYLWDNDYQRKVYERNHDSFIAVSSDNKLVGYINYLSITKELYEKMLNSNEIVDDFDLKDIIPFGDEIYLTINSIVILKEHQDGEVIRIINNEFLKKINSLPIKGINTIAISDDGNKWCRNIGFKLYKQLDDGTTMYIR